MFSFIGFGSFSQTKQYLYYFDNDFNSSERAKSIYYGIGTYINGLVELRIYKTNENKLSIIEHFTDSSLQIREGLYRSFKTDSSIVSEGKYLNGKEEGLWQQWDSLGHIIDSTVYFNGEKNLEISLSYHKSGILGSYIVNNIKTNQLHGLYYDESSNVVREVNFAGENGIEKLYKNGNIISSDSLFTRSETEAYFPGGNDAWTRYIMNQIQIHSSELGNNDYGLLVYVYD